tara:strand:- start:147 stop:1259 length:1113 start_codon:yes stop_codon:yes gene_type:complete
MGLSDTTYGVTKSPRVYVDNFLLARTLGMKMNIGSFRAKHPETSEQDYIYFGNNPTQKKLLWDMDPVRYSTFASPGGDWTKLQTEFFTYPDDRPDMKPFLNLMHTSNYAAVLNHNLYSGSDQSVKVDINYNGGTSPVTTGIVGEFGQDVGEDGFIISRINLNGTDSELFEFDFNITPSQGSYLSDNFEYNIGSFSVGTYIDFPFSPDLEVKTTYSHEGVQSKRTIAGKDLTHVSYSGAPNWGKLPPFTTSMAGESNFQGSELTGRKAWDMKFSYIDKTDMFNRAQSGSSAGSYWRILQTGGGFSVDGFKNDNSILNTYLSRTLGGKLKHILQPDNTKKEFYMVKLDQNATNITQMGAGVFGVSLKFVQVW